MKRQPITWIPNNSAPIKICPDCGKRMDGSRHVDVATHDGWKHVHNINIWLYHCPRCETIETEVIDYDGCEICDEEAREHDINIREKVMFT